MHFKRAMQAPKPVPLPIIRKGVGNGGIPTRSGSIEPMLLIYILGDIETV